MNVLLHPYKMTLLISGSTLCCDIYRERGLQVKTINSVLNTYTRHELSSSKGLRVQDRSVVWRYRLVNMVRAVPVHKRAP